MTDMDIFYGPDGMVVRRSSSSLGVCEQHPDREFPHGDCAGPGCPPEYRVEVLRAALRDIRIAAVYGDKYAARWLRERGIDVRSGDDL